MAKEISSSRRTSNKTQKKSSGASSNIKPLIRQYFPWTEMFGNFKNYFRNNIAGGRIDITFFVLVVVLLTIGLVMMFSASYVSALYKKSDPYYYIKRQLIFSVIGLFIMWLVSRIHYDFYRSISFTALLFAILLLVYVLINPAKPDDGSEEVFKRWIAIGPLMFQPSEIAKIALVMYCAWSMERRKKMIHTHSAAMMIPYAIVICVVCGLVMLENHLSGTILIGGLGLMMTLLGGVDIKWHLVALAVIVVGVILVVTQTELFAKVPFLKKYAYERIISWLDKDYDPLGARWQTNQSLYAIGSGGIFGLGLGKSRQKHLYMSEPQNDFIFAIVCEELGLVGAVVIIALFVCLICRGYKIAMRAKDTYSSLLVMGIVAQVGLQTVLNIAVVTDSIPNTGIGLPFFSYGGTSIVMLLAEMGMILGVSRYSKIQKT